MDQAGATKDATTQDIANLAGAAISSAVAAHVAAADPHPGYLTQAEGDSRYRQSATALTDDDIPAGIARDSEVASAISTHVAAADPHSQYLTQAEGDGRYRQSATALSDSDIPAGIARDSEVAAAIGAHEAAADPHPGYLTAAEGNAAYEAAGAVAAHVAAADPHTQYVQPGDSPSFTGLTITGTAPVAIPHIHGSIAGNFYVHVKNTSGGPLAAGTAVYATGSVGDTDRITVAACDPTDPLKMPAIAVLETTLANNDPGDAVVLGELRPINTAAYTLGAELYVGAAGALVATLPASGIVQRIGVVARVQSNTGTIVVGIGPEMARVGFTGAYGDLGGLPPLGTAAAAASTDFAPAAQGVTNGNSHNHDGGDGAQIAYNSLSGLPGVVSPSSDGLAPARSFSTITYGATVALDFASLDAQYRTISLTGNLVLTTSNLANGRTLVIRLVADANQRTLTFPTVWKFLGTKPANIAASKVGVLSITAFGTTNDDVVAAYAVQS